MLLSVYVCLPQNECVNLSEVHVSSQFITYYRVEVVCEGQIDWSLPIFRVRSTAQQTILRVTACVNFSLVCFPNDSVLMLFPLLPHREEQYRPAVHLYTCTSNLKPTLSSTYTNHDSMPLLLALCS